MKPTNLDEHGCDPISSNCVIWQGPDIDCINLCKGDTVSDVVFKLATELCDLMDTFKISNYDLTCLGLAECTPKTFQELIQLLIEKICECCDVDPDIDPKIFQEGCPDCEVTVCSAFYTTNSQGDTITTMQLVDYARAIGNKVCDLILEIQAINLTLENHENRITILEEADPATYTPPQVTPCAGMNPPLGAGVPTEMNLALQTLMDEYCGLVTATGQVPDLYTGIGSQCVQNSDPRMQGSGDMSSLQTPGGINWVQTVTSAAESLTNIWLAICDLRAAVAQIQNDCCDNACDTLATTLQATLASPTDLEILVQGTVPPGFGDCAAGSSYTLTDTQGGTQTFNNQMLVAWINAGVQNIDLTGSPVDGNYPVTVDMNICYNHPVDGTTCNELVSQTASPPASCPPVSAVGTVNYGEMDVSFTWTGAVPTQVSIEVWNQSETVMLTSTQIPIAAVGLQTWTFNNLGGGTFKVRLESPFNSGQYCPFSTVILPGGPCVPVDNVSVTVTQEIT